EKERYFTVKPVELGRYGGDPADTAHFIANVSAIRSAESNSGWDKAILRALPHTFYGPARLWFASMPDEERQSAPESLEALLTKIEKDFMSQSVVHRQTQDRRRDSEAEDAVHHTLIETALLKTGFPSINEEGLVHEVADGINTSVAQLLQTPFRREPTPTAPPCSTPPILTALNTELRVQETYSRVEHNRPLPRPDTKPSTTEVPRYANLTQPTGSAPAAYIQTSEVGAYKQTP
ncbi:hypothetical protein V8E36_003747, partial [Tilletia maclaganii]